MIKWNEAVSDRADEDLMFQINREQDDEFCQKAASSSSGGKGNLPRRCEHGPRHEETYLESIDGLNKEKPMPEARSLRRLSPNPRQRPVLDRLWRCQRAQEITEVVGERMKLEPHRIGGERPA